jgi:hypothetical protein
MLMQMRTLLSAVVVGVGLLACGAIGTDAEAQPVNIHAFIVVEYGDPAYARQGPFYFRYWPGSSPNTTYDFYSDIPGKCSPPTVVIDGNVVSGPFFGAFGRGTGSPTDIHSTAVDSWGFLFGNSLVTGGLSYTAFGYVYDCVAGDAILLPEGFTYVFRFAPASQTYYESFGYYWVGDTLYCQIDRPWFEASGTPTQPQITYCNWYYTWSKTQFIPSSGAAAVSSFAVASDSRHQRRTDRARELLEQLMDNPALVAPPPRAAPLDGREEVPE